jgi:hypothetical protein
MPTRRTSRGDESRKVCGVHGREDKGGGETTALKGSVEKLPNGVLGHVAMMRTKIVTALTPLSLSPFPFPFPLSPFPFPFPLSLTRSPCAAIGPLIPCQPGLESDHEFSNGGSGELLGVLGDIYIYIYTSPLCRACVRACSVWSYELNVRATSSPKE